MEREYRPLFAYKARRLREGLPQFNELPEGVPVTEAVRGRFHRERLELLERWHGHKPVSAGVKTVEFAYANGAYTGGGTVYMPLDSRRDRPLVVYIHGGNWHSLNSACYAYECLALAQQGRCVVVGIDYRLAPEFRYPVYLEDCYAALCEAVRRAEDFGANPARVVVAEDSAGGNIATVLTMLARERGGPDRTFVCKSSTTPLPGIIWMPPLPRRPRSPMPMS